MSTTEQNIQSAKTLINEKKYNEASDLLYSIIKNEPHNIDALNQIGQIYIIKQELDKAMEIYKLAYTIDSKNAACIRQIAYIYYLKKDYDLVIEHLQTSIVIEPETKNNSVNTQIYNALGFSYLTNKNYSKAIENYNKALSFDDKNIEANFFRGKAYYEHKDYNMAIKYYKKAIELKPNYPDFFNELSYAYVASEQLNKAIEILKKSIKINPNYDWTHGAFGDTYRRKKDYIKSIKHYIKAIELNPNNVDWYNNLANVYIDNKEYDKAINILIESIDKNPTCAWTYNVFGWAYENKKEYEQAIEYYKKAISIDKRYFQSHLNLGNVYNSLKDFGMAIECYKKAVVINQKNKHPYINMVCIYCDEYKDFDNAEKIIKDAILNCDEKEWFYSGLGAIAALKNDFDNMVLNNFKAIDANPSFSDAYYFLALFYYEADNKEQAIEIGNRAIKHIPKDITSYLKFAEIYDDLKQYENAKFCYQKVLAIEPNNQEANEYLNKH